MAETRPVTVDIPGVGAVERRQEVTQVNLPFVSFRSTYRFASDGAVITSDSTLRFRSRQEIAASLAACGYQVTDVRDAPDRPGREFVFIAERSRSSGRDALERPDRAIEMPARGLRPSWRSEARD